MQTTRPASIAALLLAASLLLSGCGSGGTEPTASPRSSGEPVFASEEEALAAAEDAFAAYLAMTNLIGQEGNVNPERIAPFVSEESLSAEVDAFTAAAATGERQLGSATFDSAELQQVIDSQDEVTVVINLCMDLSDRKSLNAEGKEINLDHVADRIMVEVTLSSDAGNGDPDLRIEGLAPWPDSNC